MQRSNIIFNLLISEKTIEGRVCCAPHMTFAGCSETPGAPRESPLFTAKAELGRHVDEPAPVVRIISVSVFSHSQNEHFDLDRTRRTIPRAWVWHGQSVWEEGTDSQGCWSTSHQRVSVPGWVRLDYFWGWARSTCGWWRVPTDLAAFNSRNRMKAN